MPSLYLGRHQMELVREEKDRLEQQAKTERDMDEDELVYVPEKDALESLLSAEAKRRLERKRENGQR